MLDDTCFPAAAMTNYARPILWRNKTETERRCKVLCGDDPLVRQSFSASLSRKKLPIFE